MERKTLIVAMAFVLLAGSALAGIVIAVGRAHRDAQALQDALDAKRQIEGERDLLKRENDELRSQNDQLSVDLQRIEENLENGRAIVQPQVAQRAPSGGSDSPDGGQAVVPKEEGEREKEPSVGPFQRRRDRNSKPLTLAEIKEALASDDEGKIRGALDSIEKLENNREKLDILRDLLMRQGDDQRMKSRVLRMLEDVGGSEVAAITLSYLESRPPIWSARRAIDILMKNADSSMTSSLYSGASSEYLPLRQGASLALKKLGDPRPLDQYVQSMATKMMETDASVRQNTVLILATLREPETFPHLVQALSDTDSRTRMIATWGLGNLKSQDALPYLQKMTNDPNEEVKRAATGAINRINNPNAKDGGSNPPRSWPDLWR